MLLSPSARRDALRSPQILRETSSASLFAGAALTPIANIGIILLATLVAVSLVPVDVQPAGVLKESALAMAIGLVAAIAIRVWKHPTAAFDPLNVIAASPLYWLLLDPIQGAYDMFGVSPLDVQGTFVAIGLFCMGVWLAPLSRPWRLPAVVTQAATTKFSVDALFRIASVAFGLAFLRFAIPSDFDLRVMWGALFEIRWAAPWGRGSLGGWDAFLDHISYFGYILPTLAVLIARGGGWLNRRTLITIGYSIVILALLSVGGGRRIIGVLAGSAFVVWFLSARPPRLKHLLVFAALAAVLLGFMQLLLLYRGVGLGNAFVRSPDQEAIENLGYLHVDDNFLRTSQLISIMPTIHPHVGWQWLVWVAVRPIPRVFWPGKPIDPGFSLPDFYGMQDVSLSSSLIGELYMAFGYIGCLAGGWFLGRIALILRGVIDREISPGALVLFGSGLLALFTGMRSGIELVLMSYVPLAWVGIVWGYRKWLVN